MVAFTRRSTAGVERVRHALSSADGAALAGAAAAVLLSVSAYLLARQPGVRSASQDRQWYADSDNRFTVLLALNLAPLGVVAFLWFMAVIRRRLGEREDRFFATVFLGSGFAFAVLTLAASVAAAAPTLVVWAGGSDTPDQTTVSLAHGLWFGLWQVSASRFVGVFMAATSTVGRRFGAFPRWLSTFGIVAGGVLGITGAFIGPFDFLFPLWLLVVSGTLFVSRRRRSERGP